MVPLPYLVCHVDSDRNDVGSIFVQMFDSALASWLGEPSGKWDHNYLCEGYDSFFQIVNRV